MGCTSSKQENNWNGGESRRVLGAGEGSTKPTNSGRNPNAAAAEAAERRLKASQARGTHASNPRRGELAAKANKPARNEPEPRQEERIVVRHCFAQHSRLILTPAIVGLGDALLRQIHPYQDNFVVMLQLSDVQPILSLPSRSIQFFYSLIPR
ncbi:hypothetical protein DL96DRAFT_1702707 [Flagelloscypha sp. PMI_526]|nr:hypothetical protein DL96DRAFT_1702707 [Flagelloscypha sp. PMI_526]